MDFKIERLVSLRESKGLNKAQAAKLINVSAMAYGRYESGERVPSFQTVSYIAKAFETSTDYLYGLTDSPLPDSITISYNTDAGLFELVKACQNNGETAKRLLAYYKKISE